MSVKQKTHHMQTIIALALVPVFLLFIFIYCADKVQHEPVKLMIKGLIYGVGSCFVTLAIVSPLPEFTDGSVIGGIFNAFFTAAIPEECSKLLMLWLLVRGMKEFDEPFDGIVYATCVGLGFAGFENIFYLISNEDSLLETSLMRGITAVPGHFFFAVTMGYYYAAAHFGSKRSKKRNLWLAIVVPVMLHGIYDSLLMIEDEDLQGLCILVWIVFCLFMFKSGLRRIKSMRTPPLPAAATPPPLPQQYNQPNNSTQQ